MSKLYFAYGSNLWLEQMKERCPNHRLIGDGVLRGYRWIISKRGYANIVKSAPDEVHGIVYEIKKSDEDTLDVKEGVNKGSYRKETLSVEVGGKNQSCLVYVDLVMQEGSPQKEYIERMNRGIRDAKLSPEYVKRYIRAFIPESSIGVEDKMSETAKISGASLDIAAENRTQLKALFPTIFTETKNDKGELVESIDFEKLKAELGTFTDLFETRRERYGMDWPGKKEALRLIQTPSAATLQPSREESVNFDTTENLFIEGDNLEVLKLLQKSYYGKVKMIYIDPPYNTGKEFIYPDNYSESLETYLEYAGLIDGEGKKFSTNTASEGRFHTKWLNMMYPRLYLARNLLGDDGVIFISIDDNEASNLRKMCDEIFGEDSFIADICVVNNLKGRNDKKYIATANERFLMYVKSEAFNEYGLGLSAQMLAEYKEDDTHGKYRLIELRKRGGPDTRRERPNMYYPFFIDSNTGAVSLVYDESHVTEVYPVKSNDVDGRWRWGKDTSERYIEFLIAKPVQGSSRFNIYEKDYLENKGDERRIKPKSVMSGSAYSTDGATKAYRLLMDKIEFDNPKPVPFLQDLITYASPPESSAIILDFFAGSSTTAHAVLDLNKQDNGNRKFIMVQLPEPCAKDSEAFRAGHKTIADIGKERIRRVIKKLNEEQAGTLVLDGSTAQDRGFKVFKLDKSNFKQWQKLPPDANPEEIEKQLSLHIDHIGHNATQEDLLFEILIKAGFMPTEKVQTIVLAGISVFSIADGGLLICLADTITKELINAVAETEPMQFICLDKAFGGNDQLKANAVQTFAARNMGREKANQIIFKTV
ncbi:MAG: DNA methyltransferase [Dissulfurispiraceae bacterium]